MNKKLKWTLITFLAIALGIFGYYQLTPKENDELKEEMPQEKKRKTLEVHAKVLEPHLLTDEILAVGNLVPDEEVQLSFESSGKITHIHFTEGSYVRKGTLLAKVNDSQLQAHLKRLETQVPLAEERVYRQNALLQKDAVSKEALEIVKTELATLKADIEMVKAQIRMTELRAPFDGIIGLRRVSVGTYASPTTAVATLTSIKPIKIEFSVAERYANEIKKGTNLTFKVDGRLEELQAKVYATESSIDSETHNLQVRAIYPNTNGELIPGQFADIRLMQKEIPNAISVPSEAIVPEMGKSKVFVYRNGKAVPVDITTGIRTSTEVQVLEGVSQGDTVITSGTLQLRKDMKVIISALD